MVSPSPKRRKASPTRSVPGNLSPARKKPTRASFLSPTKASLARFNPGLFPRPPSAGSGDSRPNSRGKAIARGQEARAYILGDLEKAQPVPNVQAGQRGPREDAPQVLLGAEVERETSNKQTVPENGVTTPQKRQESPVNHRAPEEEADLPLTPKEQGLQEPEDAPRRGILYSSPSKRPRRNKTSAKPSPLKPKQLLVTSNTDTSLADDGATEERSQTTGRGEKEEQSQVAPPHDLKEGGERQEKERLLLQLKRLRDEVQLYERTVEKSLSPASDDLLDVDLEELM